jgi:hypothetical protein
MANVVIVNAETGEQEHRAMTPEEQTQRDKDAVEAAALAQAEQDAAAKRAADEQAWRDAVGKATTVDQIKAALLGTNLPAQPDVRTKT